MIKFSILSLVILFTFGCQSNSQDSTKTETPEFKHPDEIINPNGDSELALAMRQFHFEANKLRKSMDAGRDPDLAVVLELANQLETATPTDFAVKDSTYFEWTRALKAQVAKIKGENRVVEFNQMLTLCVACHKNTCPGPIGKINKLRYIQ